MVMIMAVQILYFVSFSIIKLITDKSTFLLNDKRQGRVNLNLYLT